MYYLKYLGFVAFIPLAIGLNLQTGQNIFFSIAGLGDAGAAFLGLIFELLAFALVTASRSIPFRILFAVVFTIQALLVTIWGIIVGMFSGVGDGASKGANLFDMLPWFLSGFTYASLGIYTILSISKGARSANGIQESEQDVTPNA